MACWKRNSARADCDVHHHDCGSELLARDVGVGAERRVSDIERTVGTIEKKLEAMPAQAERLVRVETKTDGIQATLSEIKNALRQPSLRQ